MASKATVVLLGLALFAGALAPYGSIQSLLPCVVPAECASMGNFCDMTAMTSHDSCCHPPLAGEDSALPVALKASGVALEMHVALGITAAVSLPPRPISAFLVGTSESPSPPGSPPAVTSLRI